MTNVTDGWAHGPSMMGPSIREVRLIESFIEPPKVGDATRRSGARPPILLVRVDHGRRDLFNLEAWEVA